MKSINKILILLLAVFAFASCETEHLGPTLNPEAEAGTLTFVLNEPMYANLTYVLLEENSSGIMEILTTSQPDFGFTAAVTYFVQISLSEDMSDYVTLGTSVQGETIPINVRDMNIGIFELFGGNLPDPVVDVDIFVRLRAVISEATLSPFEPTPTVKPLFSNVIRLNILPFEPNLEPFYEVPGGVFPWFIIGYNGWTNSAAGLLNGHLIPMGVIAGDHYNLDGQGTFVFTGYFEAGREFKFIGQVGSWALEVSNSGGVGIDNPVFGGGSNFAVPTSGYYTITLNSIREELTIEWNDELNDTPPTVFANMGVVGTINNWGNPVDGVTTPDTPMIPLFQANNHMWRAVVTVTADDQIKFRANSSWDNNWGSNIRQSGFTVPIGLAPHDGQNMILRAGTYILFFNDLDETYMVIRQ